MEERKRKRIKGKRQEKRGEGGKKGRRMKRKTSHRPVILATGESKARGLKIPVILGYSVDSQ